MARVAGVSAITCLVLVTLATGTASAGSLPTPMGGYGSYHKEYVVNMLPRYSPAQVMAQFNSDVDRYFTYAGCGRHLDLGETCGLDTPFGRAPVRVVAIAADGFALRSLPGHPEGADRTITVRFVHADVVGNATLKMLVVDAWGPVGGASLLGPLNSGTVAQASWQILANTINSGFPQNPPLGPDVV